MNLLELAARSHTAPDSQLPAWALGCFRRRSITFFDGSTDAKTLVIWLQSRGLTFDLRLAAARPRPESPQAAFESSPGVLARLAEVEGGIARTVVSDVATPAVAAALRWEDWDAFQPYPKWPEPGLLHRVGDCLIEFAPSGAYVEDWRYQSAGSGPLIGLRLLGERVVETGEVVNRGGGLVVCGNRAGWVRGRAQPLSENARPAEMLRQRPRDRELFASIFDFEASYAVRVSGRSFVIEASTLPWREGSALDLDGFSEGHHPDFVVQRVSEQRTTVERLFQVDTLQAEFLGSESTAVSAAGAAWLDAERDTLCAATTRASDFK